MDNPFPSKVLYDTLIKIIVSNRLALQKQLFQVRQHAKPLSRNEE